MDTHTCGQWTVIQTSRRWIVVADDGEGVATLVADACGPSARPDDEREANARLIAASPDLLTILEWFLSTLDVDDLEVEAVARAHFNTHIELWNAAIAVYMQAKGE